MSKVNGSSNTSSSRLAEMYHITTLSSLAMAWPPISVSSVAVRRKCSTGVAQRRISSAATSSLDGSSTRAAYASGFCMSANIPYAVALRVVSLPATDKQQHEHVELEFAQPVAVDLGVDQFGDDVVARVAAALVAQFVDVGVQLDEGRRPRRRWRTRGRRSRSCGWTSRRCSLRSSWGTPMISAIACSGSSEATSVTKSAEPRSMTLSTIRTARCLRYCSMQADHARGEALVDQQPVAGVLRRIGVEHHQASGVGPGLARGGGHLVGVVHPHHSLCLRGEQLRVPVDGHDIGVADEAPKALGPWDFVPGHALVGAQPAKHLVMFLALKSVQIEQIDATGLHCAPPG